MASEGNMVRPEGTVEYTVMRLEFLELLEQRPVWVDVATVTVPSRSHRKTIVERAFHEARCAGDAGDVVEVRILGPDASRVVSVSWEQPPPQLKLAGGE